MKFSRRSSRYYKMSKCQPIQGKHMKLFVRSKNHNQGYSNCSYCPKAYNWLKHRVKTFEQKYHCPYCNKHFFSWKKLCCHLHIHEKPFSCKICKKKFDKKLSLRLHLIHKHFQEPCSRFPSIYSSNASNIP